MTDDVILGMQEAELRTIPRQALTPEQTYAEYEMIRSRPSVPYTPPQTVEISKSQPNPNSVFTPEVSRVTFVISVIGVWATIYAERAAIMAFAAPLLGAFLVAAIVGGCAIFLVSGFSGGGSRGEDSYGSRSNKGKTENHYHNHYYQNNYQGTGGQNNTL